MLKEDLNKLSTDDIYSLVLFIILQLRQDPDYAVLSELIYSVNQESLLNLCKQFGGMTIKIPTLEDLDIVINALILYCYVQIDHKDFEIGLGLLDKDESTLRNIIAMYEKIVNIVSDYDFRRL